MRLSLDVPPAAERRFDVVGLGLNSIDLLAVIAEFPIRNSKQPLQRFARLPGGQTATAMAACARLGWRARYIGRFGDDEHGRLSIDSLVCAGVDVAACVQIAGATNQFAVILVDAGTGERTVLWDRHPALSMRAAEIKREDVGSGRVLLVDCHDTEAATQAARYARATGMPTVVDVEKMRPGVAELLSEIDIIIAAREFPTEFTGIREDGGALAVLAREFRAEVVCVTLGEEGSLARCGGREIRTPAFRVECVDSTGAGDVFRAGFIAGWLRSAPHTQVEDVLTYANAVAALNCRALGAREGIPTADEVGALLRRLPA